MNNPPSQGPMQQTPSQRVNGPVFFPPDQGQILRKSSINHPVDFYPNNMSNVQNGNMPMMNNMTPRNNVQPRSIDAVIFEMEQKI